MKKMYASFVFSFFGFFVFLNAQNFTQEGNEWRLGYFDWMSGWYTDGVLRLEGDSTINGIAYNKINKYNSDGDFQYVQFLVREDSTQKVFRYNSWANEEHLIYDFQAEVGDTIKSVYFNSTMSQAVITEIDSIQLIDGSFRKRQKLLSVNCPSFLVAAEYWIEGIGGESLAFLDVEEFCTADGGLYLNCFQNNGELLHGPLLGNTCDILLDAEELEEFPIEIFPNPVALQLNIFFPSENFSSNEKFRLVNLNGKVLEEIKILPYQEEYNLSVEKYPVGIYFLQYIKEGVGVGVEKVIIN